MTCTHMNITPHLYWSLQTVMAFNYVMQMRHFHGFQWLVRWMDDDSFEQVSISTYFVKIPKVYKNLDENVCQH